MPIDIERARRDTPAVSQILHFNNAGAALMPPPVLDAHWQHLSSRPRSAATRRPRKPRAIERIYDAVARPARARPRDEIAFVENATRAWDMAFYAIPFGSGDRILTAAGRVRQQLHRLPAGRAAQRRRRRRRAERRAGAARCRGARTHDRRARQADRHHARADQWRPGQSGGGGRAHRPRARHPLPARRLPIGRPDADRRRRDRLRHAVRHRAQVSARAARHRVPLRAARTSSTGWSRRFSICRRRPGSRPTATRCAPTPAASRTGRPTSPASRPRRRGRLRARLGLADIEARIETLADECGGGSADTRVQGPRPRRRRCGIVTFTVEGKPPRDIVAALRQRRINCHSSGPSSTLLVPPARRLPALVCASMHYYKTERRWCDSWRRSQRWPERRYQPSHPKGEVPIWRVRR